MFNSKSQWEKLKFDEALSALIWEILVTLCISCAIYVEPMLSAMIFNSLHHVMASIERYVDQARFLFIRGVARRQLTFISG